MSQNFLHNSFEGYLSFTHQGTAKKPLYTYLWLFINVTDTKAILFTNEAFYSAFNQQDLLAMRGVWSQSYEISCLHPGWPRLFGQKEVMESWEKILGSGQNTEIVCKLPRVKIMGNMGFIICYEVIRDDYLVATNIFLRENKRWSLIHHQAGLTVSLIDPPNKPEPHNTLN